MKDIGDFKMIPVARKGRLHKTDEGREDVRYWLSRPAQERIAAVTFLVFQSLPKGERLDKTLVLKKSMKQK